jgi:large subunit ribosomal protein L29
LGFYFGKDTILKMKNKEIKSLNVEELQQKVTSERVSLQKLKFAHAINPIENPVRIRESRKMIARILTEIRAREIVNIK